MATTVTVYSKPNCTQCSATKRQLDARGIGYVEVDITQDAAALEYVSEELGYAMAPIVVVDSDPENHWCGFRPDKLISL